MDREFMVIGRRKEVLEGAEMRVKTVVTLLEGDPFEDWEPRVREPLRRRDDLVEIEGEFDWGVYSDGSRALALALLAEAVGETVALRLYDDMAKYWLSALDRERDMLISRDDMLRWAANWKIRPVPAGEHSLRSGSPSLDSLGVVPRCAHLRDIWHGDEQEEKEPQVSLRAIIRLWTRKRRRRSRSCMRRLAS